MDDHLIDDEDNTNISFYKDLIFNDTMDTCERFDRECLEIIDECNRHGLNKNLYRLYTREANPKVGTFFNNLNVYTKNKHIVEWISQLDFIGFEDILDRIKCGFFGNVESFRKAEFSKQNLPIFRIMKYCLKNSLFEKYHMCVQKLEDEYVYIFTEVYYKEFEKVFAQNKNNPDILYLFSKLKKEYISETAEKVVKNKTDI